MVPKPIRLRDFIEDHEGRLYAVSAYDNAERVGCILRYIPDPFGNRRNPAGRIYRKLEFDEAYQIIDDIKPEYSDLLQRVPLSDIARVLKPEIEIDSITKRSVLVRKLIEIFNLPKRSIGCTGSYLCGLETDHSDIDLVAYGRAFFQAREILREAVAKGRISAVSDEMWDIIYRKRNPELSRDEFLLHEMRKWNRGQIDSVYFDILFTRPYTALNPFPVPKGPVCGKMTIEATVIDSSLSFDSPALYFIDHNEISRVLSFSHTYSGQALRGELIEARGVCEEHNGERWLIVGTTREARGEYIRSLSLLEERAGT
jgi:predicted nucleotidyltransferase